MLLLCVICISTISYAQVVGDVSFLKGKWLEVAISDCGTYTSGANGVITTPPAPYHENNFDGSLGFTNDWSQDGWDLGVPDQCGDYVMPGSPEEGFALQYGDGPVYGNIGPYCYSYGLFTPDLPHFSGSNIYNLNAGAIRKSIWQGTNGVLGVVISQTTYYSTKKQSFVTIVDICNGGDDITDLYYARNVDPDNDQVTNGIFNTQNNVVKQYLTGGYSHVEASSTIASPCYASYVTADPRAKVSHGNFSMGEPYDMWNGLNGYIQTTGANNEDASIQVSYKIESLAHNDCECVAYSTVLLPATVPENVALSSTACATLGTLARYGEDLVAEYLENPIAFLQNEFFTYPNPSNGNFTLNMFDIENANIRIVNALGEVVYTANGVSNVSGIYLDNALPGLYFITVEHDGKTNTKSIVIE